MENYLVTSISFYFVDHFPILAVKDYEDNILLFLTPVRVLPIQLHKEANAEYVVNTRCKTIAKTLFIPINNWWLLMDFDEILSKQVHSRRYHYSLKF